MLRSQDPLSIDSLTPNGDGPAPAISPEQWQLVKDILDAALAMPTGERAAFVAQRSGADELVRHEVETLLTAIEESGEFLEPPPVHRDGASEQLARLVEALSDRYRFERELPAGGMSYVFLAVEIAKNRQVVIKVLKPDETHGASAERFAREWHLMADLQQANIVPVLTDGEAAGLAYYVMLLRGESLRDRISLGVPVGVSEAVWILRDVAKALAFAHDRGVVHRDIKPENVLLSGGTAVVTDFGIAKAISAALRDSADTRSRSSITPRGVAIGTPAYMAPEQAAGDSDVGPSADVYAVGVLGYELLAGVHPFPSAKSYRELMTSHMLETPRELEEHRPGLPPALTSLVMQCLAKNPAERPADGRALLSALDAVDLSPLSSSFWPEAQTKKPSVAVLPLENLTGNHDDEYFSDGIADEVLYALTHLSEVRVVARTSSFAFKGRSVDLRTIAETLGVQTVVEGTVRLAGQRRKIDVRLVRAADEITLWSKRYEPDLSDISAVQEEIAQAIARALAESVAGGEIAGRSVASPARTQRRPVDPEAFELYLRGRQLVEQRTSGMHEALHCFEQAIERAPEFSAAHAGMSIVFTLFGIYHALRPREAFPRAREAAERALRINPNDALARVIRAHVALWFEWNYRDAELHARRALELAPGLYLAHDCLGFVLAARGQFDDAIAAMQRARLLDPLSANATYDLAWILILAGRWDEALRELEPAVAAHPRSSELRRVFAFCLLYAGHRDQARAEFRRVLELSAGDRWGSLNLVQALAMLGEVDEAARMMREVEQRVPNEPIPLLGVAIMHHALGDDDTALDWLERSVDERDSWLVMLPFDPSMEALHDHPRFESITRRIRGSAA